MSPRPQRVMPAELVRALRHARRVELAAHSHAQRSYAITASQSLIRAAVDAGWQGEEIASAVGMAGGTVRKRVAADRARRRHVRSGLEVPAPPPPLAKPWDFVTIPVTDRDLLTLREAVAFAGCSTYTLRSWWRAGLLPNTQSVNQTRRAYSKADLQRVLAAPAYNNRGHSHAAVRAAIHQTDIQP